MSASILGWPWWAWVLVAAALWAGFVLARKSAGRASKRHEAERLAQIADAEHEGAKTRHEGGA